MKQAEEYYIWQPFDDLEDEYNPQTVWKIAHQLKKADDLTKQAMGEVLLRVIDAQAKYHDPVSIGE